MKLPPTQEPELSIAAVWTSRIALFSAGILIASLMAHRLFSMPTPVLLNLIVVTMAGAIISIVLGVLAAIGIWFKGSPGVPRVVTGALVSLALLSWPLSQYAAYSKLPPINDITTDWRNPPQFDVLARQRPAEANDAKYPGPKFSTAQRLAYPDLVGLTINRSSVEAFEVVADAMKREGLTTVNERVPGETVAQPGFIEAYDRTLILGYYDDVVVRVAGDMASARVDIRSASRYGKHDLGQNAVRVRALLKEIVNRLEASVPSAREQTNRRTKSDDTPTKRKSKRKRRRR